jgi:hypothetical protein
VGGSSWAIVRLDTQIGLTEFRTRDLLRNRHALHLRTEIEWMSNSGLSPQIYNIYMDVMDFDNDIQGGRARAVGEWIGRGQGV